MKLKPWQVFVHDQKDLCSALCCLLTLAGSLSSLSPISVIGRCSKDSPGAVESHLALLSERPGLGQWLAVHPWESYLTALTFIFLKRVLQELNEITYWKVAGIAHNGCCCQMEFILSPALPFHSIAAFGTLTREL